ncbi:Non-ribosomal peptide synthase [Labilithrix luteola]|uniref:Non-ribosomal peptide synthase n=1 Tax=Labilithrix luteola TaxID=1391654 RepID=A0A0K1Q8P7_9BACT|nr:fatty acyl-AMP ligase [Labilithrix luteola]AKV01760.1 Non-ribosomal peptide synthase [Labilithrix luteola]
MATASSNAEYPAFPTLAHAIEHAAKADPTLGFRFVSEDGVPGFSPSATSEASFSYTALERSSARYGGALQALGLEKGDRVALILPANEDFVLCFFGAIRAGIIPVPIYPPLGIGQLQTYLDNTRHIVAKSGARALVTTSQIKRLLGTVQASSPSLEQVVAVEAIRESLEPLKGVKLTPDDVAFLQFTSGSTSRPKGVTLTHANLMANMRCIVEDGLKMRSHDVGVSWLPLYHDMGLIGFVIAPLAMRTPVVFLPPLLFLKRPITWFQAMTRHKGTVSFGPNFAFALCVKRIREKELEGIDLSSWRVAGCGAEPIRPETLENFVNAFSKVRFDKNALLPSYGMAESSLAVTFTELGEGMKTIAVDSDTLWAENVAKKTEPSAERAIRLVSCGKAFPLHDVRVFAEGDETGATPLPEGHVGELRIKGPSVMKGYWEDAERTKSTFAGEWLKTGDLGFLDSGHVFICGRSKEVIIVNGRNYYPQDIEWEASHVAGVRKGNIIAFGARDPSGVERDRERVVVAFEVQDAPKELDARALAAARQPIVAAIRKAVQEGMGLVLDDVVPLAHGVLPKTSSGKLQRAKTRELYEAGELLSRKGTREHDRVGMLKEAAKSQLSYFKLAVLGGRKKDD